MKRIGFLVLLMVLFSVSMVHAGGAQEPQAVQGAASAAAPEQIYREGWLSGAGVTPTFITTATHRLDITVNEPLVAITWQGGLKPMLAESYEMNADGSIWTFHLRKGIASGEPETNLMYYISCFTFQYLMAGG